MSVRINLRAPQLNLDYNILNKKKKSKETPGSKDKLFQFDDLTFHSIGKELN